MTISASSRRATRLFAAAVLATSLLIAVPANALPAASLPATTTVQTPSTAITVPLDTSQLNFQQRVATKQAQLQQFKAELDQLDTEMQTAQENYQGAQIQLIALQQRVTAAQGDLQNATEAYNIEAEVLRSRADSMYKDGSLATLGVLLDSKNFTDLMQRVKFINSVGLRDADIVGSLRGQRDLMQQQVNDLKNAQAQAQSLQFELKARKIEVELRIQERQQMMAGAESDLATMLNKQAVQRNAQEQVLLQQILSGVDKAGITVEPGSPVETALAYHGVPYLWGGATPAGFDCSGLVMYVFAQHGVTLPHYSGAQFLLGEKVPVNAMLPGDCVFFGNPVHHVAIYIGGGYVIQAPHTGDVVRITKLSDLAGLGIAGARRYPWTYRVGPPLGEVVNPSTVKLP